MHQVKIFKGIENELSDLQNQVNSWLKESGAKVVNVFGNIAPQSIGAESGGSDRRFLPSDIMIVVVYEQ